jgi:hypothetical protein
MTFTLQVNKKGELIICKGNIPKKRFKVISAGNYEDCMYDKIGIKKNAYLTNQNTCSIFRKL